jgi:uncharacterized protein (TIGR02246 family)
MKKCSLYLVFILFFGVCAHAQNKTDEAAVRAIPQAFVAAWAKHDAHELAKVMSENVDFVNISADWLHGRQNFEIYHTRLFAGVYKHTEITQLDAVVRFLRPDVAVVNWSWSLTDEDAPKSEPRRGMFMMVVEKRAGGWLVADAENTPHFEGGNPYMDGITPPIAFPATK